MESFDQDPSRMLTQEQANRMETYARLYSDRTKSGSRRRPRPKSETQSPNPNHNGAQGLDNTSHSDRI